MIRHCFILICSIFLLACNSRTELGSKQNPLRFALVPGQDSVVLTENGKILADWIQERTGLYVQMQVPTSFIAVVEAMGSNRVDIAIMNTFGYMLAHQKYGASAQLISVNGESAEYWGQIITSNPKVQKLQDLVGKKFAYVDAASSSGYILPAKLFRDEKVKLGEIIFAGKHDSVVTMVYQGRVDAGATYHTPSEGGVPQDARRLVRDQFPDVYEKVRIIKMTNSIPSDPVVFRNDLPKDLQDRIIVALKEFSSSPQGPTVLKNLYHITGFRDCTDVTYDSARKTLLELGKDVQDLVK